MPASTASTPDPYRITPDRAFRWVAAGILTILAVLLLWTFARLVAYLLVGFVLAYLMRPVKDRIQGLGIGRIGAILVTFLVFFGVMAILVRYLAPFAAEQIAAVSGQLSPSGVARTVGDRLSSWLPVDPARVEDAMIRVMDTLLQEDRVSRVAGSVFDLFANIFYALIVVPFVTFFFLKDGSRLRKSTLGAVPNRYFEITLGIIEKVEINLGRYFRAIGVQSLSIMIVSTVLLSFAGLEFAAAVGIFTGLANTIPYFGPLLGFAAGTIVGISQTGDFSLLPGVLVAMILTQFADNILFQPMIFSRAARAHPLVILFVVLVGAQLGGVLGMLIAIPVVTTFRVLVREIVWSYRNYRSLRLA